MEENHKFRRMVFNEKKALNDEVDRLEKIFQISEDGAVLPKNTYPAIPRIMFYMLGRRVAKLLGFLENDSLTLGEITVLSGSSLRSNDLIQLFSESKFFTYVGRGGYRLNTLFITQILDELEKYSDDSIVIDIKEKAGAS